jgi:hypothetical protein
VSKIPVGQTIGHAYAFAFRRYFHILGVIWLPFVLLGVAGYFALVPLAKVFFQFFHAISLHPQDKTLPFQFAMQMQRVSALIWAFDLLNLTVGAVIAVGIVKEALGFRKGFRIAYFWFGLEELLLVVALFLFGIMIAVFSVAALVGIGVVVGVTTVALAAATHAGQVENVALAGAFGSLAALIAACLFIYFAVRFLFFMAPVTVAEREFGMFRSWELSKGNFWRIFVVLFITWVPVFLVFEGIVGTLVGTSVLFPIFKIVQANPHGGAAMAQTILAAAVTGMVQILPYLGVVYVLAAPIVNGLAWAPCAFAYRALVPPEPASIPA